MFRYPLRAIFVNVMMSELIVALCDGGTGDIAEYRAMYAGGRRLSCYQQDALSAFAKEHCGWDGSRSLQEALRSLTHDQVQQFHESCGKEVQGGLVCFTHGVGDIAYIPSNWLVAESVVDATRGFAFGFRMPVVVSHRAAELADVDPAAIVEE